MRNILSPLAGMAVLAAILSCSEERIGSNPDGMVHGITVTGTDFVYGDDTRAAYTVDNSGFHFTWTAGDTVGIYPVGADQVAFPISSGDGSQTAQFDGGAWALRADRQYAAYYPFDVWNYLGNSNSIPVSYIGQTQSGNASTAHLDRYDYMASAAVKSDLSGCVNITMKHLGSFVRFQLTMPQADTYSRLTLTDSGSGFVTTGTYDLSSQTPAIKSVGTSKTISMDLKNVSTTSAGQTITLYMMLAPGNLSSHKLALSLSGKTGITYKAELEGKDLQPGKAYSYSKAITSGTNINGEDVSWGDDDPSQPTHEYVDLGLSVMWATCNVGASKPEEYGDYFAWGETEPYYNGDSQNPTGWKSGKSNGYDWYSYQYCYGSDNTLTKYCFDSSYGYNGYTDSKTVLDPEDDAAHVNWGGSWRMPTYEEQEELRTNCTWTRTTINGIKGYKVQSNKSGYTDRWIFLPAAGSRNGADLSNVASNGYYWSSSLYTGSPDDAYGLYFGSSYVARGVNDRGYGQSVRPVCQ